MSRIYLEYLFKNFRNILSSKIHQQFESKTQKN